MIFKYLLSQYLCFMLALSILLLPSILTTSCTTTVGSLREIPIYVLYAYFKNDVYKQYYYLFI